MSEFFRVSFIDEPKFSCQFTETETFDVDMGAGAEKEYTGVYSVTPSDSVQILPTANRLLTDNITVGAVESAGLIITLYWNDDTEKWTPDCTFSDIVDAYEAGKDIAVKCDTDSASMTADGEYDESNSIFTYWARSFDDVSYAEIIERHYDMDANGITLVDLFVYMDTTDATLNNSAKMLSPYTAYSNGTKYTGSIETKQQSDLTANGKTVNVPKGYYPSAMSKSVAEGTAGTPTATKGTVSNHSVSVTPSVTNQTGYITGSTKTGTAVTVTASELVSGSETKTSNGTYNVTNLAELVVNVSGGGGGSSNVVHGDFTVGNSGGVVETVTLPYTGTGYPIYIGIIKKLGGTDKVWRYGFENVACSKRNDTAPTYSSSGSENQFNIYQVYKSSSSASSTISVTHNTNFMLLDDTTPSGSSSAWLKMPDNKTIKYFTGNKSSSTYGFIPGFSYTYYVIYSS